MPSRRRSRSRSRSPEDRSPPRGSSSARRRRDEDDVDAFGRAKQRRTDDAHHRRQSPAIKQEDHPGRARRVRPEPGSRLYVGNLSYETEASTLRTVFAQWGVVSDVHVPAGDNGKPNRGFAFVTLRTAGEASAAVAAASADGALEIDGRAVRVREADRATPPAQDKRDAKRPPHQQHHPAAWGKPEEDEADRAKEAAQEPDPDAQKPDFGLSGALAKDAATGNVYKGHVLKFAEPDDAAKPRDRWRLYVFKDEAITETLHIHRQSAFLVGRIRDICDVLTAHPSCSGQHAVLQFRARDVPTGRRPDDAANNAADDGAAATRRVVLPYVMDLDSTNGTYLNGDKLEAARYVELREKDVLKFGHSTREYVLMKADF